MVRGWRQGGRDGRTEGGEERREGVKDGFARSKAWRQIRI